MAMLPFQLEPWSISSQPFGNFPTLYPGAVAGYCSISALIMGLWTMWESYRRKVNDEYVESPCSRCTAFSCTEADRGSVEFRLIKSKEHDQTASTCGVSRLDPRGLIPDWVSSYSGSFGLLPAVSYQPSPADMTQAGKLTLSTAPLSITIPRYHWHQTSPAAAAQEVCRPG